MAMGKKTKIDWAESTWNPVTGCFHGCAYCYAKRIAERFGGQAMDDENIHVLEEPFVLNDGKLPYPFGFDPTLHEYRLGIPQTWKQPRSIFVCSMSDLFGEWVPESWVQEVFSACEAAPQHTYMFLTKNPKRLQMMYAARQIKEWNDEHPDAPHQRTEEFAKYTPLPEHDNWWWGSTITTQESSFFQGGIRDHVFLSIEPIQECLDAGLGSFGGAEWIIVGAETGNRKDMVVPKKFWIDNVVEAAGITHAAVFMKESLRELMKDDFRQEFPFKEDHA